MTKSLRDLITEEITSEERLIDSAEKVTPDQLKQIIDEIMIYAHEYLGVSIDPELEDVNYDERDVEYLAMRSEALTIFYFLRTLMRSGRVLISPIR